MEMRKLTRGAITVLLLPAMMCAAVLSAAADEIVSGADKRPTGSNVADASEALNNPNYANTNVSLARPYAVTAGLAEANNEFGFKLLRVLAEQNPEANICISPLGLSTALAMTYNGARGRTSDAMATTLELSDLDIREVNQGNSIIADLIRDTSPGTELELANSIWADSSAEFKPVFLKTVTELYGAAVTNLNFGDPRTVDIINGWISKMTKGRIGSILDVIPSATDIYLVNTIYFKGRWAVPFNREYTYTGDFALSNGTKKPVEMMVSESEDYLYYDGDGFVGVGLPYDDDDLVMYFFLPNEESSLAQFYKKLGGGAWRAWIDRFHPANTLLILPHLEVETAYTLNQALKRLGMEIAFTDQADFRGMTSGASCIGRVLHNTYLEVDEEGAEAASAAVVEMKRGRAHKLVFDRPFFFAIRDKATDSLLLTGSILEP